MFRTIFSKLIMLMTFALHVCQFFCNYYTPELLNLMLQFKE